MDEPTPVFIENPTPSKVYPTTPRGFSIYTDLVDQYGSRVRVQQSSIASQACVWIFCENDDPKYPTPSPHLTVEQAKEVMLGLADFIAESKLHE